MEHMNQIDDSANARMDILISKTQKQQIDEMLKVNYQIAWGHNMNNIHTSTEKMSV